jgi:hypothetical protein
MRPVFLKKVYRYNKKLFFFFVLFSGLTLFANFSGEEFTPFFVWGMYSEKEAPQQEYSIFKISVNEHPLDYTTGYLPANRFFLLSPLTYYASAKNNLDPTQIFLEKKLKNSFSAIQPFAKKVLNNEEDFKRFPVWYQRYLYQTTGENISNYKVEILNVYYDADNIVRLNSGYTLINEK